MALPPERNISTPAREANSWTLVTIACGACVGRKGAAVALTASTVHKLQRVKKRISERTREQC
jgi:H+/Cl- antiporter ClcA